jgi:hypothetical protein
MSEPETTRQQLGCGFTPLPPENLMRFRRVISPGGYKGVELDVCPGYSTSLPEVIEVARARFHWKHGGPATLGIADWQFNPLMIGIEILEGAVGEADRWAFDNPEKK